MSGDAFTAMTVMAMPKPSTDSRVNVSPAHKTNVANKAAANMSNAGREWPKRRVKINIRPPAMAGPNKPDSKTTARSQSLPLKVWARPENCGVMIILSKLPLEIIAPKP